MSLRRELEDALAGRAGWSLSRMAAAGRCYLVITWPGTGYLPLIAGEHHNLSVLAECWKPSGGLRAVAMASGLVKVGFFYLMVRFFFPRVFLMPAMVIAGVWYAVGCLARFRVLLDAAACEVAITRPCRAGAPGAA